MEICLGKSLGICRLPRWIWNAVICSNVNCFPLKSNCKTINRRAVLVSFIFLKIMSAFYPLFLVVVFVFTQYNSPLILSTERNNEYAIWVLLIIVSLPVPSSDIFSIFISRPLCEKYSILLFSNTSRVTNFSSFVCCKNILLRLPSKFETLHWILSSSNIVFNQSNQEKEIKGTNFSQLFLNWIDQELYWISSIGWPIYDLVNYFVS